MGGCHGVARGPGIDRERVRPHERRRSRAAEGPLGAISRSGFQPAHGWPGLDVLPAGHRRRLPGRPLRALLHVAARSGRQIFRVLPGVHGLDARRGAVGQSLPAGVLLGTHKCVLLPAHRLLAPQPRRTRRRAHGPHHHLGGGPVPVRRRAAARPHRGQLRPRCGAGGGRPDTRAFAVPAGTAAGRRWSPDQIRAVSVPLLVTPGDGGADAGVCLPSLGRDGQAGRVPAGAALAGAGRHRSVDVGDRLRRTGNAGPRRLHRHLPARPERPAGLFHREPSRPGDSAARAEQPARAGGGRFPCHEPRDLQGLALHGGRHHRPRIGHPGHPAAVGPVPVHADHCDAGDGGCRGDGGRSASEWLPLQGDVLFRVAARGRAGAGRSTAPCRSSPQSGESSASPTR